MSRVRAGRLTADHGPGEIVFRLKAGTVSYRVEAAEGLSVVHVAITGPGTATVAYRTVEAHQEEHGAWVTRGETAADAEGREVFIDGSGPLVFGHSKSGKADAAYVLVVRVRKHIQPNGRTEQRSNTFFKSGRYRRFQAVAGLDDEVRKATNPPPSVNFTVFVDGSCRFDSGAVTAQSARRAIDVDLTGARTLALRLSNNWDNDGRSENDHGDWADAKLLGRTD